MVSTIVAILGSVIGIFIGHFLTRKKYGAETKSIELQNISKMIDLYKGIATDFTKQIEDLTKQVSELKNENRKLRTDIVKLEKIIKENKLI